MYFIEHKREIVNGKFSIMKSPMFGDLLVKDPNGELPDRNFQPSFDCPTLAAPVIAFPLEMLTFILSAFSSIKAMQ